MEKFVDISALEHERDELLKVLDCGKLDPISDAYSSIRKAYDDLDRRCQEWHKMNLEQRNIDLEYRKCDSQEKITWFQLIGSIGAAAITSIGMVASNVYKYKTGEKVIRETTREAFGMDQEKVQSRVAADTAKKGIDFFLNR